MVRRNRRADRHSAPAGTSDRDAVPGSAATPRTEAKAVRRLIRPAVFLAKTSARSVVRLFAFGRAFFLFGMVRRNRRHRKLTPAQQFARAASRPGLTKLYSAAVMPSRLPNCVTFGI